MKRNKEIPKGNGEYIKVAFMYRSNANEVNFEGLLPKLPRIPEKSPDYPCGCYFGFETKCIEM